MSDTETVAETVDLICGPEPVFITDFGVIYPPGQPDGTAAAPGTALPNEVTVPLTADIQALLDAGAVTKRAGRRAARKEATQS